MANQPVLQGEKQQIPAGPEKQQMLGCVTVARPDGMAMTIATVM